MPPTSSRPILSMNPRRRCRQSRNATRETAVGVDAIRPLAIAVPLDNRKVYARKGLSRVSLPFKKRTREEVEREIRSEPLGEFFVWWDEITEEQVQSFIDCVASAEREQEVQTFFEENPILLIQHLGGGHGRWVIPQKRLGAEYVPDFVIGERSSIGFEWQAVELERPTTRMFKNPRGQILSFDILFFSTRDAIRLIVE